MDNNWDKVITSKRPILDLRLKQIIEYWDLLILLVKRDFVITYKQTILGPLWHIIQPICSTIMYIIVFGNLAGLSTDGIPQPLFYFSGTMLWTFFSNGVSRISNTFNENKGLFGKVYFPRMVAPLATAMGLFVKLAIQFILFIAIYIFFVFKGMKVNVSWEVLLFPFIVIWIGFFATGAGLIVSAVTTKYRDLGLVLTFFMSLMMYGTPVVYPLSTLTGKLRWLVSANPVTAPVEVFRWCYFGSATLSFGMIIYSISMTVLCVIIGMLLFNRTERTFVDVI